MKHTQYIKYGTMFYQWKEKKQVRVKLDLCKADLISDVI